MMNLKNICVSILVMGAAGCSSTSTFAGNLTNFGEDNASNLSKALREHNVHVLQIGDSHTAADVMSDALRVRLQDALGNGGMGWGMPMYFSGQRLTRYGYDNAGWEAVSSRTQKDQNYSLGGLLAVPTHDGARLTVKAKQTDEAIQKITVSLRQGAGDAAFSGVDANGTRFSFEALNKDGSWQTAQFIAKLPFTVTATHAPQSAIGGWWAKNISAGGAVVSALGINGGELNYWNRWNERGWQSELGTIAPDLLILAYGTNEAYDDNADIEKQQQLLTQKIRDIRRSSPQTAVMIVSAPESLKSIGGACGTRPRSLSSFQAMQKQVAQSERTLFWDWQQAMGGHCSMKTLINRGEARADGVHFTSKAYQNFGTSMANDLLNWAGVH